MKAGVVLSGLIMILVAAVLFFITYSQQHLIYNVATMIDLGILPPTMEIPTMFGTTVEMYTLIWAIKTQYGGFFLNQISQAGPTSIYVYYSDVVIATCLIIGLFGLYALFMGAQS